MFSVEKTEFPLPNVWKLLTYELIKGPCFWRATVLAKRTECAQIFVGQDYLAVEPQAADFKELLVPFYETIRTSLNALSSLSLRAMSTIRYASYFLPSISASLKSLTYFFFFLSSPSSLCSLPPSVSRSHPAFGLFVSLLSLTPACASCRPYDLQMNCMLRSWSTRPLARSWTMPSMTWHLCRCALSASHFSCYLSSPSSLCGSHVPSAHLTVQKKTIKKTFSFLLPILLSLCFWWYSSKTCCS